MSRRHRVGQPNSRGIWRCYGDRCTVTGTLAEVTAHIRYGVRQQPDGSWSGPANTTAASLGDLLAQLGLASA